MSQDGATLGWVAIAIMGGTFMIGRCTAGTSEREIDAAFDRGYAQGVADQRVQRPINDAIVTPEASALSAEQPPQLEPEPERASEPEPAPAYFIPQPAYEARERDLYFANCSDARASGYSNILAGEPGYRHGMDRDGDGVACEG